MLKNENGIRLTHENLPEDNILSLDEAIEMISKFNKGSINTGHVETGNRIFFTFDNIKVEDGHLVFKRFNCDNMVSLPIENITEITLNVFFFEFVLISGESWIIHSRNENVIKPHIDERCEEIEIDDFLDMLRDCKEVSVYQWRSNIEMGSRYDIIEIKDTDEDGFEDEDSDEDEDEDSDKFEDDRKVKLVFDDTRNMFSTCIIDLGYEWSSKFYLSKEFEGTTLVYIGLQDAPFTVISIILKFPELLGHQQHECQQQVTE